MLNAFASTHHFSLLHRAAEAAQVGASPTSPVGGHSNGAMQASTSTPNPNTSHKSGDGQATSRDSHSTPLEAHIEQNTQLLQTVRTSSPPVEKQTNTPSFGALSTCQSHINAGVADLQHQLSALRRPASPTYTTSPRNTHWTETPRAASAYPMAVDGAGNVLVADSTSTRSPAAKDDLLQDWMLSPAGKRFMETQEGQAWLKTKAGVEWQKQKQKKEDEREEAEPGGAAAATASYLGYRLRDQQDAFSVLQQKVRVQQDQIDKLKVCVCACARVPLRGYCGWHSWHSLSRA